MSVIQGNAVLQTGKTYRDFRTRYAIVGCDGHLHTPVYKGNEDAHIMASPAERMKQSRCFYSFGQAG